MITVFIDAGGTKTDWCFLENQSSEQGLSEMFFTVGINPNLHNLQHVQATLSEGVAILLDLLPKPTVTLEVYYFGAGCGSESNRSLIETILSRLLQNGLPKATIQLTVQTDLAFAGQALWQNESGLIAILGTGANAGYYNLGQVEQAPSLGFWLGDEGSGGWLGKEMIKNYFRDQLPERLAENLKEVIEPRDQFLSNLYKHARPSELAGRLVTLAHDEELLASLTIGFEQFIGLYLLPLAQKHKVKHVKAVGGIAYRFAEKLKEALAAFDLELLEVKQKPLDIWLNTTKVATLK